MQTFVNYACKKSYNINPRDLFYKNLRIRELKEMKQFRSKLVSSSLEKHTSLNKQAHTSLLRSLYITNT